MFFLAVSLGLVAWPLVSYIYPTLLSQTLSLDARLSFVNPQLSTFIEDTLARENIIGLSVAVVPRVGETKFHAWGYRTEDGDKVTRNTLFRMVLVTRLVAHGRVGLEESHMSGLLARHDFSYGPSDTPQELITRLRYLRPAFELREQFTYNNIMYMVATHVVATYSGQSYTSFVEERIFIPLGMSFSTFSPTKAEASGKSSQGWAKQGRRLPEYFTEDTAFTMAGPAGIISNAVDMAKWISLWIGQGIYDNQTIIPLSIYKNMSLSHSVAAGHPTYPGYSVIGYGMGWYRSSYRGHDELFRVLFANGEGKGKALTLTLNRILDSALRLDSFPPKGSSLLNPADVLSSPPSPKVTTSEFSGNLMLSLDFAGTYVNPGYVSFTFCSPTDASSSCAEVQSKFLAVDSGLASNNLFAKWPRVRSSHLRLRHLQGLVFEVYFSSLYQNGYGKDRRPFETRDPGSMQPDGLAEFVIEDGKVVGFGINGLVGQLTERARKYETVRDRAEVWFDKV